MATALVSAPVNNDLPHVLVEATQNQTEQKSGRQEIPVILPDLFVSFLSRKPQLNPHYERVRAESEAWFSQSVNPWVCQLSPEGSAKISKANCSYFMAIMGREAGPDEYRTLCDWGNWVFPFDDMFDEGSLKDDPEKAGQELQNLLAAMVTTDSEKKQPQVSPIVQVHNSVWFRFAEKASRGARERFVRATKDFCEGVLSQVQLKSQGIILDPKIFLETRRQSIGAGTLFAQIEYCYDLDLPDEVFEHKSIIGVERVATDLILIHNDMLSYCKEQREGSAHNLVALYRLTGMGPQEAFDQMGELLKARFREWYLALAELPQWGEAIDTQVQKYISGVQDVVLANLNWSFKNERYFGKQNTVIRKNRTINLLPL